MEKTKATSEKTDWKRVRKDREEYFEKLRKWLDEARLWYSVSAGFPLYCAGFLNPDGASNNREPVVNNAYPPYQNPFQPAEGLRQRNNQPQPQGPNIDNGVPFYQTYPFILPPNLLRPPTTYEFRIPPLWKRFVAELIDFCILFALKLGLTFLFMESFSIGGALDIYGSLDAIQKGLDGQEVNYPLALELVLLEIVHRVIVCAYETYFLKGKLCSTPGKRFMGLMVVSVETLALIPNRQPETISATGVQAIGWQRSLLRAILKNLIVGLLLPLCISFYVFPFNRTSYDRMANTLVVEAHPEFLMYQAIAMT